MKLPNFIRNLGRGVSQEAGFIPGFHSLTPYLCLSKFFPIGSQLSHLNRMGVGGTGSMLDDL